MATKQVKFYSPDGSPIRVTHPDGAVVVVGGEPRILPAKFNRAAVRAGCLTTDMPAASAMQGPDVPDGADAFKRRDAIKAKITEALNSEEGAPGYESAFTQAGVPNLNWLSQSVGFNVERSERDEIWTEVQTELDAAEAGQAEG